MIQTKSTHTNVNDALVDSEVRKAYISDGRSHKQQRAGQDFGEVLSETYEDQDRMRLAGEAYLHYQADSTEHVKSLNIEPTGKKVNALNSKDYSD